MTERARRARRFAVAAARHASHILPARRAQWADAMRRELDYIEDDRTAVRWAFGCVVSSYWTRVAGLPRLSHWIGTDSRMMRALLALAWRIGRVSRAFIGAFIGSGSGWVRGPRWVLLALLALLVSGRIADWRPFSIARDNLCDTYQANAPSLPASSRVVVVEIDEASLAALGQWPWSRTVIADLTRRLSAAGAVVGFDIVFAERDRVSPDADGAFAQAIGAGRVVLGFVFEDTAVGGVLPTAAIAVRGPRPERYLPTWRGLVNDLPLLARSAVGQGFFNVQPDPDGVLRHVPLLARLRPAVEREPGPIVAGLPLELARIAQSADGIAIDVGRLGITNVTVGALRLPTDRSGQVWPNFSIEQPRALSAVRVLEGGAPAGSLAGKIAIIGASAAGLRDIRQTPIGQMPGVYLHARALGDMLDGTLLWRPAWCNPVEIALMIASGLVVIVAAGTVGRRRFVTLWVAMTAALFAGSFVLHRVCGLLLDPSASTIATTVLVFAVLLISVTRQSRPSVAMVR